MDFFGDLFQRLRDLPALVQWAGYVGLFAIIFTETGLFFGFFLPGDSLLVTAGLLISQGLPLDLLTMGGLLTAAAILGDNTNYWIGRYVGPKVFSRERSRLFNPAHLERTQRFYEKFGAKMIFLARFMPIVRTFAPFVAGIGRMRYGTFLFYSFSGSVAWVGSLTYAGYYFGNVPVVKQNLTLVILAIVLLSISPAIVEYIRHRASARRPG